MRRRWLVAIAAAISMAGVLALAIWSFVYAFGWLFSPPVHTTNELPNWDNFAREVVAKDFRIPNAAKITLAESYIKGFDYGYKVEFTLPNKFTPIQWLAKMETSSGPCTRTELKIECEVVSIEYLPDLRIYRIQSRPL